MNIKYAGEAVISYLIEKCKSTFASITHAHTAQEVGADVQGSASAALVLAEKYTDEAVAQKSQVQMVKVNETDSTTETLSTLKIHKLTRSQYEQMVEDGTIDENSIYLTQDDDYSNEDLDEILANKSDVNHNHDSIYETKENAEAKLAEAKEYTETIASGKADTNHNHDSLYDTKGAADNAFESSKEYTDIAVANLVNSAPETLDTIGELATAFQENEDIVETLNNAITNKADKSDLIQSDYAQNNSVALDYIKNRPCYEEIRIVEVVSEQSLIIDEEGYLGIDGVSSQLTAGQTYHVTFNGIEYDCVARKSGDAVLIGNGTIYGDGNAANNEPFVCDSYNDGAIYLNAAPGEYTLSITETVSNVHYLDHKYIKDMYYEEKTGGSTLTWDGITEGLFKVEVMEDFYLYKISDATPTLNECMENCTAAITTSTGVLTDIQCIVIPFDSEQKYNAHVILANNSALYVINEDGMMLDGAIFAEKGIYTDIRDNSYISKLTINGYDGFSKIKKIDEKYMPGSVASKTYVKNRALFAANEYSERYEYFPQLNSDLATKEYVDQVGHIPMSHFTLVDTATGYNYIVEMNNGSLVSYCYDITDIYIATPPSSLMCGEGGMINTTGMVVNAICADGTTRQITGYSCSSVTNGRVTIKYAQDGQIYTTTLDVNVVNGLGDFTYTSNNDGTVTLTGWKGTTNGVASKEIVFPDDSRVIL